MQKMIYEAGWLLLTMRLRVGWVENTQMEVHRREAVSMRTAEWRTCLEGAQQRMRGLWEHRRGKRSVEVKWFGQGAREEKGRKQAMPEDQRSSVSGMEAVSERRARTRSMALFSARRHSFTLRKLWTWARAGKACTEEDREIQRGADTEGMQGGGTERKKKACAENRTQAHTYTHTHLHTHNRTPPCAPNFPQTRQERAESPHYCLMTCLISGEYKSLIVSSCMFILINCCAKVSEWGKARGCGCPGGATSRTFNP